MIKVSKIIQSTPEACLPEAGLREAGLREAGLREAGPPQGRYLNCVVKIQTTLSPYELLKNLQKIEADLGRIRTIKNGPRNIDLDILLYGDTKIREDSLCIPHPRMLRREFVIKPLQEIAPGVVKSLKTKVPRK